MSIGVSTKPSTHASVDKSSLLAEMDQNKERADSNTSTPKRQSPDTDEANEQRIEKKSRRATLALTHSERIVLATKDKYRPYFSSQGNESSSPVASEQVLRATLEYPAVDASEMFLLMQPVTITQIGQRQEEKEDMDEYNPVTDIYRTIMLIYTYYLDPEQQSLLGDQTSGVIRNLTKHRNRRNGPGFMEALKDFSQVIRRLKSADQLYRVPKTMRHPNFELASYILFQVYSRTVAQQADALNNYKAFSNNVYGEINGILVKEFIERTNMTSRTVFMDLGCGIGNVVLQVAAQTGCEAYGIEIMETPCKFAKRQLKEYAARMRAWCLPTGKVHFRRGDFLDTSSNDMYATLKRADVLLVNNYAFDAATNHALTQLFLDLKDGTRIISLKSFVPKHHKINLRTFHMPESILRVKEFEYYSDAVSWTNNGGTYYIATVDRSRLKPFYDQMANQA